jgi:hypothetical protein
MDLQDHEKTLCTHAHASDSVLCAFAAMAVTENRLACPVPEGEIARTEGWIAVHDGRPTRAPVDRAAFVEAVVEGAEAVRGGDFVQSCQGSTTAMPQPSKSAALRVATDA